MGIEFEYKIYKEIKNDIMLSPDTLQMLEEFREYVENIDFFDKDILKTKYSVIQGKIISEIREAGNSKAIHTRKELECIFECIYVLARHFGKKQVEIIDIFNLRANDFAKLGIFPIRSYEAYSQSVRFRLLPKGWGHRESSSIADLINKTVLSPYVCSGVVVLSNDAELYASPADFDKKNEQLNLEKRKYEVELAQMKSQKENMCKTPDNLLERIKEFFQKDFMVDKDEVYGYKIVTDEFIQNCIEKIVSHKDGSFDYYISLTGANHPNYINKFSVDYKNRYVIPQNASYLDTIEISYEEANEFAQKEAKRIHGFLRQFWKPLKANLYIV